MILYCTFEELTALSAGAERVLAEAGFGVAPIAAPPQIVADLEALAPRLTGDLSIATLADQRSLARAVGFILADLRARMDSAVLTSTPSDEFAVQAYFEYANVLGMEDRLRRIGQQMSALIELMTGTAPTDESASIIAFPDE